MREIKLRNSKRVALVDDADFDFLSQFKWWLSSPRKDTYYAYTQIKENGFKTQYMHQLVSGLKNSDHKDFNGLNNQSGNLRSSSHSQNKSHRRIPKHNTSGFKGVGWHSHSKKWRASIAVNKKRLTIGYFQHKETAAEEYNKVAICLHKEFAVLNSIPKLNPAK